MPIKENIWTIVKNCFRQYNIWNISISTRCVTFQKILFPKKVECTLMKQVLNYVVNDWKQSTIEKNSWYRQLKWGSHLIYIGNEHKIWWISRSDGDDHLGFQITTKITSLVGFILVALVYDFAKYVIWFLYLYPMWSGVICSFIACL